ncbi:MAG: twin-arginine translocase TatA/TatE family subunit [Actinomycetota bacterium]|jgi:sec-independent protein translocase protein TatA|nr:twin-arginine translocase TatA/TatE family subunit [Actinomycetota bacterium]
MLIPMGSLGAPELLIVLVIILLVFGGAKLPKLARSLGQAQREFKQGTTEVEREEQARAVETRTDGHRAEAQKDSPTA